MRTAFLTIPLVALLAGHASAQSFIAKAPPLDASADRVLQPIAPDAATSALKLLYRVPGVRASSTTGDTGSQTTFLCTNYSPVPEKIQIIFKEVSIPPVIYETVMPARQSEPFSTHATAAFGETIVTTGILLRAMAVISASTVSLHCTGMIHNAATPTPEGIDLNMVRFNAYPGSQE